MKYLASYLLALFLSISIDVSAGQINPPSHSTVFKDFYGISDSSEKVRTGEKELTSIWFTQLFQHDGNTMYVVFTNTQYEDTCGACGGGVFGAITYKQFGDQWQVVSKQVKLGNEGRYGNLPDVKHVDKFEFSSNNIGLFIYIAGAAGQGVEYEEALLYVFNDKNWRNLGNFIVAANRFGDCIDNKPCIGLRGKLSISDIKNQLKEYPDIEVNFSKVEAYEDRSFNTKERTVNFPERKVFFIFDGSKYVEKCNYFDDFVQNNNGTITDSRSNTIWQVCAVGQKWDGNICKGKATEMQWWDAMDTAKKNNYLGKNDWRLPTDIEFDSIIGFRGSCNEQKEPGRAISLLLANTLEAVWKLDFV